MGFYIGQKKEHDKGWFSFWIAELSLDSLFSFLTAIVVILGILAALAFASPVLALIINGAIAFGIIKLFIRFLGRGKKQSPTLWEKKRG